MSQATFEDWVNAALLEVYNDLPPTELRPLISEDAVALVAGEGQLPTAWDIILAVKDVGVPALNVPPEYIQNIDSNQFFSPTQTVWSLSDDTILVRPTSLVSVDVAHRDRPTLIVWPAGGDTEITEVNERWHIALVHLITSYAYAQEEDHTSAEQWRARYLQQVSSAVAATGDSA